jgi:hypothetical protein
MLSIATTALMVAVAAWESISLRPRAAQSRSQEKSQSEATSA